MVGKIFGMPEYLARRIMHWGGGKQFAASTVFLFFCGGVFDIVCNLSAFRYFINLEFSYVGLGCAAFIIFLSVVVLLSLLRYEKRREEALKYTVKESFNMGMFMLGISLLSIAVDGVLFIIF